MGHSFFSQKLKSRPCWRMLAERIRQKSKWHENNRMEASARQSKRKAPVFQLAMHGIFWIRVERRHKPRKPTDMFSAQGLSSGNRMNYLPFVFSVRLLFPPQNTELIWCSIKSLLVPWALAFIPFETWNWRMQDVLLLHHSYTSLWQRKREMGDLYEKWVTKRTSPSFHADLFCGVKGYKHLPALFDMIAFHFFKQCPMIYAKHRTLYILLPKPKGMQSMHDVYTSTK